MKKKLLLLLLLNVSFKVFSMDYIVPQPLSYNLISNEKFQINNETKICYNVHDARDIAIYLKTILARHKSVKLNNIITKVFGKNIIQLSIDPYAVSLQKKEAYVLVSDKDKISITGKSKAGLFYGVQTLLQMLPVEIYSKHKSDIDLLVNAVKIEDEPVFEKFRGVHIDISRHFRTKDEMFNIIDYMAMHKFNVLHLHFSDDQGWRLEIKKYPKLTEIGSIGDNSNKHKGEAKFFTQEDMKDLIAYAKKRYISIMPELDMPGHMEAVIRSYPELAAPSDKRDQPRVIRLDNKGRDFCKDVLKEINELFNHEYIHFGCDEVNLGSKGTIYSDEEIVDFVKEMATYIKFDLKKTPIVWDDAFEKGWEDKETLVHWWRYGKIHWWKKLKYTIDQKVQLKKQPYILSPANYTYLDMKNAKGQKGAGWAGEISTKKIYEWKPFESLTNHNPNLDYLAQGIITCTWSESIKTMDDFEERVFPRLAAIAEKAWRCNSSLSWEEYKSTVLKKQIERYDVLKLNHCKVLE